MGAKTTPLARKGINISLHVVPLARNNLFIIRMYIHPISASCLKRRELALLVAMFLCLLPVRIWAQQDSTAVDTSLQQSPIRGPLSNPRKTIARHLIYLQEASYQPNLSAQSLDTTGLSGASVEEIAEQLKQIYDGESFFVDTLQIPNDPDYRDSLGRSRYLVFPRIPDIYVTKVGEVWLYSRHTVFHIPIIHQKVFPFGSDFWVNLSPKIGQKKFLGLKIWQYQGVLVLLLICTLAYYVLSRGLRGLIMRVLPKIVNTQWLDPEKVKPVARPLSVLLTLFLFYKLFASLLLPIEISTYISLALRIIMSIFGILAAFRLVDLFSYLFLNLAGRTETTMDDQLIPLLSKLLKIVVGSIGIIFVLQNLNINVTALLAGISIGGLALALAAQDTAKNFIGSITIFVDRPFQIGDFIESSAATGSIVEIGVRSTRIRAVDGAMMTIPNGTLANLSITNHGVRTYRRYSTTLGLMYDTPPDLIEEFVNRSREIISEHPKIRKTDNMVYFNEMGDSSLNVFVAIFVDYSSFEDLLKVRQELFLSIMTMAEEIGVGFAFPSTSLYVEKLPPSISNPDKS